MHSKEIRKVFEAAGIPISEKEWGNIVEYDATQSWCCGVHAVICEDGCVHLSAYCLRGRGGDKSIEEFKKDGSSSVVGYHSCDWDPDDD